MKQTKPFSVKIEKADKLGLESFAKEDGIQRGIMFSTSGKAFMAKVSATAQHPWLFKTKAGEPFKW